MNYVFFLLIIYLKLIIKKITLQDKVYMYIEVKDMIVAQMIG